MYILSNIDKWQHDRRRAEAFVHSMCDLLRSLRPRIVNGIEAATPLVVYTDAAFEGGIASWGSVVFDRHSGLTAIHWGRIDPQMISSWQFSSGEQICHKLKLMPCLSPGTGIRLLS